MSSGASSKQVTVPVSVSYALIWRANNRGNSIACSQEYFLMVKLLQRQDTFNESTHQHTHTTSSSSRSSAGVSYGVLSLSGSDEFKSQVVDYSSEIARRATVNEVVSEESVKKSLAVGPDSWINFYQIVIETPTGKIRTGTIWQCPGDGPQPQSEQGSITVTITTPVYPGHQCGFKTGDSCGKQDRRFVKGIHSDWCRFRRTPQVDAFLHYPFVPSEITESLPVTGALARLQAGGDQIDILVNNLNKTTAQNIINESVRQGATFPGIFSGRDTVLRTLAGWEAEK